MKWFRPALRASYLLKKFGMLIFEQTKLLLIFSSVNFANNRYVSLCMLLVVAQEQEKFPFKLKLKISTSWVVDILTNQFANETAYHL